MKTQPDPLVYWNARLQTLQQAKRIAKEHHSAHLDALDQQLEDTQRQIQRLQEDRNGSAN